MGIEKVGELMKYAGCDERVVIEKEEMFAACQPRRLVLARANPRLASFRSSRTSGNSRATMSAARVAGRVVHHDDLIAQAERLLPKRLQAWRKHVNAVPVDDADRQVQRRAKRGARAAGLGPAVHTAVVHTAGPSPAARRARPPSSWRRFAFRHTASHRFRSRYEANGPRPHTASVPGGSATGVSASLRARRHISVPACGGGQTVRA